MKDFKMAVPECMREEIQKRLFDCECTWIGGIGQNIIHENANTKIAFIHINNGTMSWAGKYDYINFLENPLPEITLTEFYQLTKKSKSENKIEKIRDLIKQLQELTDDK